MTGPRTDESATPFRAGGRRNSWQGGWRHIGVKVEPTGRPWPLSPWRIRGTYDGDRGSWGTFRTMDQANREARRMWESIEADHARIEAHEASSLGEGDTA